MMTSTNTNTQLTGLWIIVGRIVWGFCALIMLAVFVYSLTTLPATFEAIHAETGSGFPFLLGATGVIRRYIVILFYYGASALLFSRRSNDRVVLIASLTFLALGSFPLATGLFDITSNLINIPPFWQAATTAVLIFTVNIAMWVVLTYPDGRFVPSWGRWLMPFTTLASFYYGLSFQAQQSLPFNAIAIVFIIVFAALWLQVKRFRQASSTQRQQVKFFIVGVAGYFAFQLIALIFYSQRGGLDLSGGIFTIIAEVMFLCAYVNFLVAMLFAVVRHRLWDIDFVINRSLVYGGLTLLLGGVFLLVFFIVQGVVNALLSEPQPTLSAIMGIVLVLGLFQPTRNRIRRFVDRKFYGIEIDYNDIAQRHAERIKVVTPEEGDTFGVYGKLEAIGRGGMGIVYRAKHPTTREDIAVKLLREADRDDKDTVARFHREARAMMGLNHPNIVRLHEVGMIREMPYIAMEYIAGQSLREVLKAREFIPLDEALPILRDIAAALDYAHARGIIHRDIKPGNIILDQKAPDCRAVLMDFGIARLDSATRLTQTGGMLGTLDYIAPEQIQGADNIDNRADVYSFGVLAYQMLAGELPFRHSNPGAMIMAHLMHPVPDIRHKISSINDAAAIAIMRAMAKDPSVRFATAGQFIEAFTQTD